MGSLLPVSCRHLVLTPLLPSTRLLPSPGARALQQSQLLTWRSQRLCPHQGTPAAAGEAAAPGRGLQAHCRARAAEEPSQRLWMVPSSPERGVLAVPTLGRAGGWQVTCPAQATTAHWDRDQVCSQAGCKASLEGGERPGEPSSGSWSPPLLGCLVQPSDPQVDC